MGVLAYLNRLNKNGNINDWSIQIQVLLDRCSNEMTNNNKQTRAVQQYESLTYHFDSIFNECRHFPPKYIPLKTQVTLHGITKSNDLYKEYNELSQFIGYKRLCGLYG
eukprot:205172_1